MRLRSRIQDLRRLATHALQSRADNVSIATSILGERPTHRGRERKANYLNGRNLHGIHGNHRRNTVECSAGNSSRQGGFSANRVKGRCSGCSQTGYCQTVGSGPGQNDAQGWAKSSADCRYPGNQCGCGGWVSQHKGSDASRRNTHSGCSKSTRIDPCASGTNRAGETWHPRSFRDSRAACDDRKRLIDRAREEF